MRGFDLEQLKTLVAAVDAGSVSAAVPLRFLSQSSLSEQLRKLEEAAGERLLVRGKSGVRPTAAGERLIVHARQILALSDAAWRDLHDVPLSGEVRLGISDYFRPGLFMTLLRRVSEHYPGVRLRTQVGKSDDILAAQRSGTLDIALVMQVAGTVQGDAHVLRTEPLRWVTARDTRPVATDRPLELALLPETCSLHRLACQRLVAQRIPHVVAHVASGVAGLQAAVGAGLGVGCLNASAVVEASMVEVADGVLPGLPEVQFLLLPARQGGEEQLDALAEVIATTLGG